MKIYIASHCRWAACFVAREIAQMGHEIVSGWHDTPFLPTDKHTENERQNIAIQDANDVARCDALVLVAGPDKYSGGKFVEMGIAIGLGKKSFVVGRRENMLMWLPRIVAVDDPSELRPLL